MMWCWPSTRTSRNLARPRHVRSWPKVPALLVAVALFGVGKHALSTAASAATTATPITATATPITARPSPNGVPSPNAVPSPNGAATPNAPLPAAPPAAAGANAPPVEWWRKAPAVSPQRLAGKHASACRVRHLVYEKVHWYKVRCIGLVTSAITQLGGNGNGVAIELDTPADDGIPREGEVVFSLADGQSRVFSFWTFGDGYDGPLTVIAAVVVQARRHRGVTHVSLHDALDRPIRTAQSERRSAERARAADPTSRKPATP